MGNPAKKVPSEKSFPATTRFLIVDDSQMMRKIMRQNMEKLGYKDLQEASDGHEALALLNSAAFTGKPFDMVLADLWMLDMDGFNLLRSCRNNEELNTVDFILVTAERDKKYISQALNEGVSGYIFKPVDLDVLRLKLEEIYQDIDQISEEGKTKKAEEKKKALEKEIGDSQELIERDELQAFFNAVPGFAIRVKPDGEVTEINHYLRAKYNISAKTLVTPEIVDAIFAPTATRTTFETKVQISGDQHHFLMVSQRYHENSEAIIIGISTTGQKRAEEKMKALAAQMGSIEEVAGGIAHKINIPLLVINTRTVRLQKLANSAEIDRAQLKDSIEKIETSVAQIKKIIKNLRTFKRDGEKDPFVESRVKALVDEILEFFRSKFKDAGVELRVEEIPDSYTLECREMEILQILLNLVSNAFDAVKSDSDSWVRIQVEDREDQIEISVTDSGSGIPEGLREKIMLPFFTTKGTGAGPGLGLSICKSIAEAHGGTLALDTQFPNTRFVLTLPKSRII